MIKKSTKELIKDVSEHQSTTPVIRELTPELAEKIWKSIEKRKYDEKVSREIVLHTLKQLKASIGRMKNKASKNYKINDLDAWFGGIHECSQLIDKQIEKINKK